jgi:UDP-GlcNAc:undecaprenyl-phosphate GlcNAc-1-phosphate transferase
MRTAAVAFVLSLVSSILFTPLAIRLAHRLGAIDHALSSRKIHKAPIPRLGGIAIVAAFFAPVIALLLVDSGVGRLFYGDGLRPFGLFAGGAIIALLGIYDDLKGAGAKVKFLVQFGVAALVYVLGYRIDAIANPFGAAIPLGWLGLPFTMLWIAGVINAINLIDGLDGLAGGVAFIGVAMTFVFAVFHGAPLMMLFTAALAGAILGFLRYNFNPAKIFMGDTGSMFLGFVLSTCAIEAHQKSSATVAILVPIVVLGLPIADTLLAMTRRALRGTPLFQADRGHIHHRLLDLGLTQRATVLVLYGTCILLGLCALALAYASSAQAVLLLVLLAIGSALALRGLGFLRVEQVAEVLELRRRNIELRSNVKEIVERLRQAADVGDVWDTVKEAGPVLGASSVALEIRTENARGHNRKHLFCEALKPCREMVRTRHSLLVERSGAGTLELRWTDGRTELNRDTELAVEQLCRNVHGTLSRLGPFGPEEVGASDGHLIKGGLSACQIAEERRIAKVVNLCGTEAARATMGSRVAPCEARTRRSRSSPAAARRGAPGLVFLSRARDRDQGARSSVCLRVPGVLCGGDADLQLACLASQGGIVSGCRDFKPAATTSGTGNPWLPGRRSLA